MNKSNFSLVQKKKVYYGELDNEYYLKISPKIVSKTDIIIFIHGGGWKSGSPEEFKYISQYFVNSGYQTVLLGYPLYPDVDLTTMRDSIKKGYIKVIEDLELKKEQKIVLGGASAGAHLASNLYFNDLKNSEYKSNIKSLFLLSGVLNFNMCNNRIIKSLINNISEVKSNPIDYIDQKVEIPIYLLYSVDDGIVNYKNSISYGRRVEEMGGEVIYKKLNKYSHDESYVYPFFKDEDVLDSFNRWLK